MKVSKALDEGIVVTPAVAARLRAAREGALERQRPERAPALGWADNVVGGLGGFGGLSLRVLLPIVVAAAGLAAIYVAQRDQRAAELEEVDALLLSDELPIDAYLDRGFDAWLKKRAAR
jgi:hypothetical protein